jgi:hypothetical protein
VTVSKHKNIINKKYFWRKEKGKLQYLIGKPENFGVKYITQKILKVSGVF